ncbi:hypothetical protein KRR40_41210 [Niabella defluvii]|nr:hypothetical protein KRR40_41210 [Niabella sp. I65]
MAGKKKIADSYNRFKTFAGKQYTGMPVGRSHKWYYDKGEWKETKITPDLWRIHYAVTKRRAGKAPKGSGVPVGTGYHWYITAHQQVIKLNEDDYSTELIGLKYKLAHHRADKEKWNISTATQRKHLIDFLKSWLLQLEAAVIELSFDYNGVHNQGEAVALPETAIEDISYQYDIVLNGAPMGSIRRLKAGWKMDGKHDAALVKIIGEQIEAAISK